MDRYNFNWMIGESPAAVLDDNGTFVTYEGHEKQLTAKNEQIKVMRDVLIKLRRGFEYYTDDYFQERQESLQAELALETIKQTLSQLEQDVKSNE